MRRSTGTSFLARGDCGANPRVTTTTVRHSFLKKRFCIIWFACTTTHSWVSLFAVDTVRIGQHSRVVDVYELSSPP